MGLNEGTRDFIKVIKSTREFNELIQAKSYIEKNTSLKNEVSDFNKRLAKIYSSNNSPSAVKAKVSELNRQFGSLSKIPEVDRFLKTSKVFNDMMVKVYKSMNESVEAELKLR